MNSTMLHRGALAPVISALALTFAVSSVAKADLYPNGVIASDDVTLSGLLSSGWTEVFSEPANSGPITEATISSWITDANGGYVFLGGTDLSGNVILGGTGLASQVLQETSSTTTATLYPSSNLYWYNDPSVVDNIGSVGFADSSSVDLYQADVSDQSDLYRLSWHIGYPGGGYRLGDLTALNSDYGANYEFVVLVGGGSSAVPDATATLALAAIGFAALFGFRRQIVSLKA